METAPTVHATRITQHVPHFTWRQFMAVAGEAIQSGVGRQKTRTIDQSYWSLVWWRFRRNRLAIVGAVIVIGFYVVCGVAAEFFSPYPLGITPLSGGG
jgi:hypothetical protein